MLEPKNALMTRQENEILFRKERSQLKGQNFKQ